MTCYSVERSSKSTLGLPANSSTVALMRKSDKQAGGLEVEFRGGERSSRATSWQYITVAILFYVNLINYMDRMTIAGKYSIEIVGVVSCGGGVWCLQLTLPPRSTPYLPTASGLL